MPVPAADPDAGAHPLRLGIDIGGTKTLLALFDGTGVREETIPTDPAGGARIIEDISRAAARLAGGRPVRAAVAGVPAVVNADGSLTEAPNLPGWRDQSIAADLGGALAAPVSVHNDAHLAAVGEQRWGGARDLVFIAVGTGIGAGVVSGGALVTGHRGAAGEIFDLPVPDGEGFAPLEEVASGPGLSRSYEALAGTPATTYDILAALGTDPHARAALERFAGAIAHAVAAAGTLLDPDEVILGGGLGSLPSVIGAVRACLGHLPTRPVRLSPSRLGPRAAAVGALALAVTAAEG